MTKSTFTRKEQLTFLVNKIILYEILTSFLTAIYVILVLISLWIFNNWALAILFILSLGASMWASNKFEKLFGRLIISSWR